MNKLDMFQYRFGKMDKFGWWDLEIIPADTGTKFTSMELQDEFQTHGFHMTLENMEHQETNGNIEVTRRTLRTIAHSLMVHMRVSEAYIHFKLMYTADHILPLLPIKYLIKKYVKPTTPFKIATGTKPSISYLCVLFCPFVLRKATTHVGTKALNMRHQAQKSFHGIFFGIT